MPIESQEYRDWYERWYAYSQATGDMTYEEMQVESSTSTTSTQQYPTYAESNTAAAYDAGTPHNQDSQASINNYGGQLQQSAMPDSYQASGYSQQHSREPAPPGMDDRKINSNMELMGQGFNGPNQQSNQWENQGRDDRREHSHGERRDSNQREPQKNGNRPDMWRNDRQGNSNMAPVPGASGGAVPLMSINFDKPTQQANNMEPPRHANHKGGMPFSPPSRNDQGGLGQHGGEPRHGRSGQQSQSNPPEAVNRPAVENSEGQSGSGGVNPVAMMTLMNEMMKSAMKANPDAMGSLMAKLSTPNGNPKEMEDALRKVLQMAANNGDDGSQQQPVKEEVKQPSMAAMLGSLGIGVNPFSPLANMGLQINKETPTSAQNIPAPGSIGHHLLGLPNDIGNKGSANTQSGSRSSRMDDTRESNRSVRTSVQRESRGQSHLGSNEEGYRSQGPGRIGYNADLHDFWPQHNTNSSDPVGQRNSRDSYNVHSDRHVGPQNNMDRQNFYGQNNMARQDMSGPGQGSMSFQGHQGPHVEWLPESEVGKHGKRKRGDKHSRQSMHEDYSYPPSMPPSDHYDQPPLPPEEYPEPNARRPRERRRKSAHTDSDWSVGAPTSKRMKSDQNINHTDAMLRCVPRAAALISFQ